MRMRHDVRAARTGVRGGSLSGDERSGPVCGESKAAVALSRCMYAWYVHEE